MKHTLNIGITLLLMAVAVQADVITFKMSYEFSGGGDPGGTPPWLEATFNDYGTAGSVDITLSAGGLIGTEFVSGWYFNLDPNLDATSLVFSSPNKTAGAFADPAISLGTSEFMADGDGYYDILFGFATADGDPTRFGAGDEVQFSVTLAGLTAFSFDYVSSSRDGADYIDGSTIPYLSAAHVQGIAGVDDGSGWITIPEPASLVMLLGSSSLIVFVRRNFID